MKNHVSKIGSAIFLIFAAGCSRQPTAADVEGDYTRDGSILSERVVLKKDGTFIQTVTATNGQSWELTNTWKLEPRGVTFFQFYCTYDEEKKSDLLPPSPCFFFTCNWSENHLIRDDAYVFSK